MRFLVDHRSLFVTGTDTDVGKTVVTGALGRWLSGEGMEVCAVKPIATGCVKRKGGWVCADAELLAGASTDLGNEVMMAAGFEPGRAMEAWKHPLAPSCAARLEKRPMRLGALTNAVGRLQQACEAADVRLLVEGVGGPLVPLTDRFTVADWMAQLGMPVVLVTRTELGTINHTLMAVECMAARGVRLAGIVGSRTREGRLVLVEKESLREIARLLPRVPLVVLDRVKEGSGKARFRTEGWD